MAVGLQCVGLGSAGVGLWPWVIGVWVLGLPAWSVAMGLQRGSFLVVCLGLFGDLSLFCQNKLGDVSPCGWMLQNTLLQMDRMVGALSRLSYFLRTKNFFFVCFY
jgi:hypothetical protein